MADIEIIRGYEVLPDNSVRFGIRVINNSPAAILDVEAILDYPESLFKLQGGRIQKLGNIPPATQRTAKFILKPVGCVHKEHIEATVKYRDSAYEKHSVDMRPKEIHCVCPFLRARPITKAEFLKMSETGRSVETGINFQGITAVQLTSFLMQTCANRLHKVDEYSVDGSTVFYFSSESMGEKAYYLLTVLIKEQGGLTQVVLKGISDKAHGIHGFLNEIVSELRHMVRTVNSAREIGTIKHEQVINIIDSVVQRTNFSMDGGQGSLNVQDSVVQRSNIDSSSASINIKGSVVQNTNINADKGNEERVRREKAEAEKRRHEDEKLRQTHLSQKSQAQRPPSAQVKRPPKKRKSGKKVLMAMMVIMLLGVIGVGLQDDSDSFDYSSISNIFVYPDGVSMNYTNTIGMEFVLIPAGEFAMGSNGYDYPGYASPDNEGPIHKVTIENAYYFGKYEVTQEQWVEIMGNNLTYFEGGSNPVERVSWNDAQEFVEKLNEMEGTDKYRLPSEAEWEYACRAGTTTAYSFGDDESKLSEYAWYNDNSGYTTHPVGQKKPNPWGLYDMHGNVPEWCLDWKHDGYEGAPNDGSAWVYGGSSERVVFDSNSYRVIRGGSWICIPRECRSPSRFYNFPDSGGAGFRLFREI